MYNDVYLENNLMDSNQFYDINTSNNIIKNSNCRQLSIFHQNIRSFNRNCDELFIFLNQFTVCPDIIALTETWFSSDTICKFDGYVGYHVYRENRRGGGVSIYIRDSIAVTPISEWSFVSNCVEINTVDVLLDNVKYRIIGIYRPPDGSILEMLESIDVFFNAVRSLKNVVVLGDLNVDIVNPSAHEVDCLDFFLSSAFSPLISVPTHVTDGNARCIDHIWYNGRRKANAGVFDISITDHFAIFALVEHLDRSQDAMYVKKFRDHSYSSIVKLKTEISSFCNNFSAVHAHVSLNDKVLKFQSGLFDIYNGCCPVISKLLNDRHVVARWITDDVMNCIERKHKLFRLYKRGTVTFDYYNTFKNIVTTLIRRVKRKYYASKFNNTRGDASGMWKEVNSLSGRRTNKQTVSEIEVDGIRILDRAEIVSRFGVFFSGVAERLNSSIPNVDVSPLQYMPEPSWNSMFASPATDVEVSKIISQLPNKLSGLNIVPAFIYKLCRSLICDVIASLFNESVILGVFPDCMKMARITPVFKSGVRVDINNYRPISSLSIISKIFERLMYVRLSSFLKQNKIINRN